jgi:hypothetical protein
MTAADPSAAAIVADALVPVGKRRQPDLDADTFGPERVVLSFSAVAPGPTNSFTRQRSAAAVTGCCASGAFSSSPFFTSRTATTFVSASGRNAVLMLSSQGSGSANAGVR